MVCWHAQVLLYMALYEHYSLPQQDGLWRSLQLARDGSTVLQLDAKRLDPPILAAMEEDPAAALACLNIAVNEVGWRLLSRISCHEPKGDGHTACCMSATSACCH